MRTLRILIMLALAVAVALLAGGNVEPVTLDYVVGRLEVPLAAALFGALSVGVLLGWAVTYPRVVRSRWRERSRASRPAASPPVS